MLTVMTHWDTLIGQSRIMTYFYFFFFFFLPCSPLLGNQISGQPQEGPDLLSPNLRPRHQELIPTPCGPVSCIRRNIRSPESRGQVQFYLQCNEIEQHFCGWALYSDIRSSDTGSSESLVLITGCFTFFVLSISTFLQIKPWSELSCLLKLYFCFTIASLLALLGLTLSSIYKQRMDTDVSDEDNFTVSVIQLVGICEYSVTRSAGRKPFTVTVFRKSISSRAPLTASHAIGKKQKFS